MEEIPSSEAQGREIPYLLRKVMLHYWVHKSLPLDSEPDTFSPRPVFIRSILIYWYCITVAPSKYTSWVPTCLLPPSLYEFLISPTHSVFRVLLILDLLTLTVLKEFRLRIFFGTFLFVSVRSSIVSFPNSKALKNQLPVKFYFSLFIYLFILLSQSRKLLSL
jgi:hypothetical protein